MRTIRLERTLDLGAPEPLQWNILDDARDKGMVEDWTKDDDEGEGMEVDRDVAPLPGQEGTASVGLGLGGDVPPSDAPSVSGSAAVGLLGLDGDAEEIARRLEEKYGGAPKKPKVSMNPYSAETYGDDE